MYNAYMRIDSLPITYVSLGPWRLTPQHGPSHHVSRFAKRKLHSKIKSPTRS